MNKLLRAPVATLTLGILGLLVAGCGSETTGTATLEVASLPDAELTINGVAKGTTPFVASDLPAGRHELVLKKTGFHEVRETVELKSGEKRTLDAISLVPENPDDPAALALLAKPFEIEVVPFEAPAERLTRGAGDAPPVLLLWPREDVRLVGLQTYAIEVGEEYEGGRLEFRKGKDVLWSQTFDPENAVTIGAIPPEVLDAAKEKTTFTWGIVFDDKKAKPHLVDVNIATGARAEKAEKQIDKIRADRRLAKEPPIVRDLLESNALQNYRFYSEALVKSLEIAKTYPTSIRPFEGIVTSMVRLDLKDSSLYAAASQFVGGKGQANARAGLPAGATGEARIEAISQFLKPVTGLPLIAQNPTAPAGATGPHAGGSVPTGATSPGSSAGAATPGGTTGAPGTTPGVTVPGSERLADLTRAATDLAQRLDAAEQRERDTRNGIENETRNVAALQQSLTQGAQNVQNADAAVNAARTALEAGQADPGTTPEQLEALRESLRVAEQTADEARAQVRATGDALAAAEARLALLNGTLAGATAEAEALRTQATVMQQELKALTAPTEGGGVPVGPDPIERQRLLSDAQDAVEDARRAVDGSSMSLSTLESALTAAQQAFDADPSGENNEALREAQRAVEVARDTQRQQQERLDAAMRSLAELRASLPPVQPVVK